MYFLNKSWSPMQLNFDTVSHADKHNEATNIYLILQFFLNLYETTKERWILNFQNGSSKCPLFITFHLNIFHTERKHSLKLSESQHSLQKKKKKKSPTASVFPLPHFSSLIQINLASLISLAFSLHYPLSKFSPWRAPVDLVKKNLVLKETELVDGKYSHDHNSL